MLNYTIVKHKLVLLTLLGASLCIFIGLVIPSIEPQTVMVVTLLFALTRLRDYSVIVVFAFWLPFQNLILYMLYSFANLTQANSLLITAAKEALVAFLLTSYLFKRRYRNFNPVDKCFFAYVAICVIYFPISKIFFRNSLRSIAFGSRTLLIPALLYFTGRFANINDKQFIRIANIILLFALGSGILGLLERFTIPAHYVNKAAIKIFAAKGYEAYSELVLSNIFGDYGFGWAGVRRMAGTYLDPLSVGYSSFSVIIISLGFLLRTKSDQFQTRPVFHIICLFVAILCLILSIARSAIISTALAIVILSVYYKKYYIVLACVVLALIALLHGGMILHVAKSTLDLSDMSATTHYLAILTGFHRLVTYPFGLGLGQGGWVGVNFLRERFAGAVDTFFLSMATQIGIGGLLIHLISIWKLASYIAVRARRYISDSSPFPAEIYIAVLAAVIGVVFSGLYTETGYSFLGTGMVWILAGITVRHIHRRDYSLIS